ncbi:phage adaptor protein [Agrobacterium vitis]|uniref:phage adaptor protein n=1 Tax=Agrobacterium vitis TaxID=373 RepID=UPI00157324E7|nr:hypothetical protein [Agrobacterium vitis]NSZ42836.1 hypothetical protein [Agrobacterium vitis]
MAAIADYASLLIDASDYSGRQDIAHLMPRFLSLAELKLNRGLRVSDMETFAIVPVVDGIGTLPTDLLEVRQMLRADGVPIKAASMQGLTSLYFNRGGVPGGYAIVGNKINVRPTATQDLALSYYAKIPALSPSNPTNWLLDRAADVYLYALCTEIAIWEKDQAKAQAAMQLMQLAISGLTIADERIRWGNGRVTIGGPTP